MQEKGEGLRREDAIIALTSISAGVSGQVNVAEREKLGDIRASIRILSYTRIMGQRAASPYSNRSTYSQDIIYGELPIRPVASRREIL